MYPIATAHRAQNRGFISFKITQQVVQTFSNSKPWDKVTIFFKALNTKELWNCCYSKACDGREGSFYLVELLPAQFFWFLFAIWSIYLEETQTHMATFRRLGLLTHVHSQISFKLFLEWRISLPTLSFFTSNPAPDPKRAGQPSEVRNATGWPPLATL